MKNEELKDEVREIEDADHIQEKQQSAPEEEDVEKAVSEQETFEHPDYEQELIDLIRSDLPVDEKRERLADYHYGDMADAVEQLAPDERRLLYRLIGKEETSEVFAYLDDAGDFLEELSDDAAADIIENMDADDAVDALEDLDEERQQAILDKVEGEAKEDIQLIRSYDEDEIGSRMTTNYVCIQRGLTVKQAMKSVVEQAAENDNLSTIYVLEKDESFYGTITLQDLIIAREYTDLETLVTTSYPYVYDHESVAECVEQLKDYSEDSIPVLDSERKLLGVITSQDVVEVVDEEMGEDYAKLAGLTAEEDLQEPLTRSLAKRIPWLLVLMVLGLLVSSVVSLFEPVVAQVTVVVAFQSLILGMAGNVGTQSLAVTIRVLTDENLMGRDKLHLMLKELRVGVCNGFLMGLISCIFVGLYIHFAKGEALIFSYQVSGCVGMAMMLAMTISSLTGTVIPMAFKKMNIDPAVASGPLITTLNDLVAVVSYYGLVMLLLIPVLA